MRTYLARTVFSLKIHVSFWSENSRLVFLQACNLPDELRPGTQGIGQLSRRGIVFYRDVKPGRCVPDKVQPSGTVAPEFKRALLHYTHSYKAIPQPCA